MIYPYTIKGDIQAINEEDALDQIHYALQNQGIKHKTIQINNITETIIWKKKDAKNATHHYKHYTTDKDHKENNG